MDAPITPDVSSDTLLLSIPAAAKRLSVSTRTIYTLFSTGKLKPLHIGRSCRVSAADLAAYVARLSADVAATTK